MEFMNLPWKLAEQLLESHARRKAADRATRTKDALISGVWSNSNYDSNQEGKAAPRTKFIDAIEDSHEKAMRMIYGGDPHDQAAEIDQNDPFWAAMKKGENVADMTDEDKELLEGMEEARRTRMKAMEELDQA